MLVGSTLTRDDDDKEFVVTTLSHWSTIKSSDGEEDHIKCYGGHTNIEYYVSALKGFSYKFIYRRKI